MRGFLTAVGFFFFFIAAPLAIFSFIANSVLAPSYIKGKLLESKVYEASANSVPQLVVLPADVEAQMPEQVKELKAFVAKEITPTYLRTKTEKVVDSTYDWLAGKTEDPPTISFVDLKDKVEAFAKGEGLSLTDDISKNFSKPVEIIKPGQDASKIRSAFQTFQKLPWVAGVFGGVLLLLIFLLAAGWKSKLRKLSLAFFVTGILGLFPIATILLLSAIVSGAVKDQLKDPGWGQLVEAAKNLFSSVSADLVEKMLIAFGACFVLAFGLFIVSFFVGNKPKVVPQETPVQPAATPLPG